MAHKILLIDDAEDLVSLVSHRLRINGFEVISALNGPAGIEKAKTDRPDLIILDIMMPGMSGYEVAEKLKSEKTTADIPIIFLTGMMDLKQPQKVDEVNALCCIMKPFEPKELIDEIKKALEK